MPLEYPIEHFRGDLVLAERAFGLAFCHPAINARLAEHVVAAAAFAWLINQHQAHVALVV